MNEDVLAGDTPNGGAASAGADDGWRRLHPLSPVLQGGLVFFIIVGIIVANLRDRLIWLFVPGGTGDGTGDRPEDEVKDPLQLLAEEGLLLAALGVLLAVILLVILATWLSWRFHTFRITPDVVEARKGVLMRQHRRAPVPRIQSVNLTRPLLARALGLTRVDVQTGSQGGRVQLAYLAHAEAKRVRDEILHLASALDIHGQPVAQAVQQQAQSQQPQSQQPAEAGLGAETGLNSLANSGSAPNSINLPGAALNDRIEQHLEGFVDADVTAENALEVPTGRLLASSFMGHELLITLALVIAIAVSSVAVSGFFLLTFVPAVIALVGIAFSRFNKGFKFTVSRAHDSLRTGSGLTATSTDTIPVHKIHAVDVQQPIGWRPFGWWRVRVTMAGVSQNSSNQSMFQNVVLPVGSVHDVRRVLEMIEMLHVQHFDTEWLLKGDNRAFLQASRRSWPLLWFGSRRAAVALASDLSVDAQPSTAAPSTAAPSTAAPSVAKPSAAQSLLEQSLPEQQSVNHHDLAASTVAIPDFSDPDRLLIRRGFYTRHLVIMPLERAQSVLFARPLGHYVLGLASLQVHTVFGPVSVHMRGLERSAAEELFRRTRQQMLQAQEQS